MRNKVMFFVFVILGIVLLRYFGSNVNAADKGPQLVNEVNNAIYQNSADLNIRTIKAIEKLLKKNNKEVKQPKVIDALLLSGANCLDEHANWIDRDRGRKIYNVLNKFEGGLVTDALVRQVLRSNSRLRVLFLGVKLGMMGSQEKLISVLMKHGDKSMAEDFLNSGSQKLYDGGKRWAAAHGYFISTGMGSHRVAWGRF